MNISYETKEVFWELGSLMLGSLILLSNSHLCQEVIETIRVRNGVEVFNINCTGNHESESHRE